MHRGWPHAVSAAWLQQPDPHGRYNLGNPFVLASDFWISSSGST